MASSYDAKLVGLTKIELVKEQVLGKTLGLRKIYVYGPSDALI